MKKKQTVIIFFLLFFIRGLTFAQNATIPISSNIEQYYVKQIYGDTNSHTSIKPYSIKQISQFSIDKNAFLKSNYLFSKSDTSISFKIFPLLSANQFLGNPFLSENQVGLGGFVIYKNKISLQYNLSGLVLKQDSIFDNLVFNENRIPHIGNNYYTSRDLIYLQLLNFRINLQPYKFLTLGIGKGNFFLGDGYRSLFLSDNTASYPFANICVDIWRIKYFVLYSFLNDFDYPDYTHTYKKYNTTHYLSFNVSEKWNISFFEAVSWSGRDTINYRAFDINYLNPVIFFRPVEFSLDNPSPDNILLGIGYKYKMLKNAYVYGQVFVDEFSLTEIKKQNNWWGNKYGMQFGFRVFDIFGIENLQVLSEINYVRPYTFAHLSSLSNYGNLGDPLAHPLGSDFFESVTQVFYKKNKWDFKTTISYQKYACDTGSVNLGNNIYKPYTTRFDEYNSTMFQGEVKERITVGAMFYYSLIPKYNLKIKAGINSRLSIINNKDSEFYFQFGITTGFFKNRNEY